MNLHIIKSTLLYPLGIVIGGLGGYLYWKYVGCFSGTCPITSSPIISTLYVALLGGVVAGMFKMKKTDDN